MAVPENVSRGLVFLTVSALFCNCVAFLSSMSTGERRSVRDVAPCSNVKRSWFNMLQTDEPGQSGRRGIALHFIDILHHIAEPNSAPFRFVLQQSTGHGTRKFNVHFRLGRSRQN